MDKFWEYYFGDGQSLRFGKYNILSVNRKLETSGIVACKINIKKKPFKIMRSLACGEPSVRRDVLADIHERREGRHSGLPVAHGTGRCWG